MSSGLVLTFEIIPWILQVPLKVVRGPLLDEAHQQFGSWIYQVQEFTIIAIIICIKELITSHCKGRGYLLIYIYLLVNVMFHL